MKQEQKQGKFPMKVFKVGVLSLEKITCREALLHQLRATGGREHNQEKCLLP